MRQFEVYPNPSVRSRGRIPFVVVMQSHLLASHTVLVAPMLRDDGRSAFTETSVKVAFDGGGHVVLVAELAVVEARALRQPIGNLGGHEDTFRRALDRLLTGF